LEIRTPLIERHREGLTPSGEVFPELVARLLKDRGELRPGLTVDGAAATHRVARSDAAIVGPKVVDRPAGFRVSTQMYTRQSPVGRYRIDTRLGRAGSQLLYLRA
jgi:hypothetical protein